MHQLICHFPVGVLPSLEIARQALGEKLHGQMQELPHKCRIARSRHFAVDPVCIDFPNSGEQNLHAGKGRQSHQERPEPFRIDSRQQPVQKYPGEARPDDPDQGRDQGAEHHKGHRGSGALQAFPSKGQDAFGLSIGNKVLIGLNHQADAGEGAVEGFHFHLADSLGRVVQDSLSALKTVQDHKMVEVPMDDTGESPRFFQVLCFQTVSFCGKAIAPCRKQYVLRI